MLLAIDVGNTNITFAVVTDGQPAAPRRTATDPAATAAELAGAFGEPGPGDEIVLASVVPALTERIGDLCGSRGVRLLIADHTTVPIETRVDQPAEVGADRLVNAFAALRLHGAPAIVVDFGTATSPLAAGYTRVTHTTAYAAGAGYGMDANLFGGGSRLSYFLRPHAGSGHARVFDQPSPFGFCLRQHLEALRFDSDQLGPDLFGVRQSLRDLSRPCVGTKAAPPRPDKSVPR